MVVLVRVETLLGPTRTGWEGVEHASRLSAARTFVRVGRFLILTGSTTGHRYSSDSMCVLRFPHNLQLKVSKLFQVIANYIIIVKWFTMI